MTPTESNASCNKLLKKIFSGWRELLHQIAPQGWEQSEFVRFLHPTPEQQLKEHQQISENIKSLGVKNKRQKEEPVKELTLADFKAEPDDKPIRADEEMIYLLGMAVYDIFSKNHEVINEKGRVYDLGSMRGSADFIADFINVNYPASERYDYIDFYMGPLFIRNRADFTPFYAHVFRVLKDNRCDWKYAFPRMYIFNPREIAGDSEPPDTPASYNPEASMLKEMEDKESLEKTRKLREELDRSYEESYEEAKYKKPPEVVQAYKMVYGVYPKGHPLRD